MHNDSSIPVMSLAMKPSLVLRNGTATRLVTNITFPGNSFTTHRIATAFENVHKRMNERPITQHGISGLSTPSTLLGITATCNRQIKDKRFWHAVLQSKIQEINQEMVKILNHKKNLNRDRSASKLYEKRVKEAAKELSDLQGRLTSMNLALDNYSSGMKRHHLQTETVILREQSEHCQGELELIFQQRQLKDDENYALETETKEAKSKACEIIKLLSIKDQTKYQEYQLLNTKLRKQNSTYHLKISDMENQKERLNTLIIHSQVRSEARRLKTVLKELFEKIDALRNDHKSHVTPVQERENLINDVRSNNQALSSIAKQMKIIENQLNKKKEIMHRIKNDLQDGNSDRYMKYKELKKRDHVMSTFMDSFKKNLSLETYRTEMLKNQITFLIEQITLQCTNMQEKEEKNPKIERFLCKNDLNSHTGLIKEYKKISIQLKHLQILEKQTVQHLNSLIQEEASALQNIQNYGNLETARGDAVMQMNNLSLILQQLNDKKRVTENVVQEARNRNQQIKIHLKSNETLHLISHLEDKLVNLMNENNTLQEAVNQIQQENDYSTTYAEVKELLYEYNRLLCPETENFATSHAC